MMLTCVPAVMLLVVSHERRELSYTWSAVGSDAGAWIKGGMGDVWMSQRVWYERSSF